jgi:hypothetical protein
VVAEKRVCGELTAPSAARPCRPTLTARLEHLNRVAAADAAAVLLLHPEGGGGGAEHADDAGSVSEAGRAAAGGQGAAALKMQTVMALSALLSGKDVAMVVQVRALAAPCRRPRSACMHAAPARMPDAGQHACRGALCAIPPWLRRAAADTSRFVVSEAVTVENTRRVHASAPVCCCAGA